jgi:nitrogen regulatory protein PII
MTLTFFEISLDCFQCFLEDSNSDYDINIFWREIMLSEPESLVSLKRIEIVIHEERLEELLDLFREADVQGYTVIKKVGGFGSTGERDQDDFIMEQYNDVILLVCEESKAEKLVAMLHPKLKVFGGVCLVSDCQRVY